MKKGINLVFTIIIMFTITSCYDAREVTSVSFVQIIGIDRGISDKWRITIKLTSMESGSDALDKSNGAQSTKTKTITIDAPSFHGGINMLNTNVPQKIDFTHAAMLVLSEDMAQSGLFGEYITPLIRFREIRRTLNVVVVQGSAQEFIEKTGEFTGRSPTRTIISLLNEGKNTGFYPKVSLYDFYNGIKSTYRQAVLPMGSVQNPGAFQEDGELLNKKFQNTGQYFAGDIPRKGGNSIEFLGSALFNGDRMVSKLDGHETRIMMLLRGDFRKGIFTIQDPKAPEWVIPIDLRLARKPKVKIYFYEGRPIINLEVKTEGDILAIQSGFDYENDHMLTLIEKAMQKYLENNIKNVINKCQSLNTDVFNFGRSAARNFWTIEAWENYNWNEKFKDAIFEMEIDFKIRRTGGLLRNSRK